MLRYDKKNINSIYAFKLIIYISANFTEDIIINDKNDACFFRKWPFSGEDDRGKTSPRALVFTRCDIQSERL